MSKDRGKMSQQHGNASCSVAHINSGVKSIDNQCVNNVVNHIDANKVDSIDQYQSKYVHVNRFAPLTVDDDNIVTSTDDKDVKSKSKKVRKLW